MYGSFRQGAAARAAEAAVNRIRRGPRLPYLPLYDKAYSADAIFMLITRKSAKGKTDNHAEFPRGAFFLIQAEPDNKKLKT
jgi:hypothetical protein